MELSEHLEQREVGSRIVDNTFTAVLDQEFEELESFVDLAPFFGRLLGEALVDHRHDLVESLAVPVSGIYSLVYEQRSVLVEGTIGDLLHQGRRCAPAVTRCQHTSSSKVAMRVLRFIVGCLPHLRLHFCVVHHRCRLLSASHTPAGCATCQPTILHLPHASLDIVESQVLDRVAEVIPIHCAGVVRVGDVWKEF